MKNFGLWMKGLAAAMVGGAVASAAQAAASGSFKPSNLKTAAITGAALTLGAYLTQSPVSTKEGPAAKSVAE
jgi:hypothetical protein